MQACWGPTDPVGARLVGVDLWAQSVGGACIVGCRRRAAPFGNPLVDTLVILNGGVLICDPIGVRRIPPLEHMPRHRDPDVPRVVVRAVLYIIIIVLKYC